MSFFFSKLFRYRESKTPDVLGLYPERVHIESFPERRYLWTSRIMVITCVLSICLTIMLALSIYVLLPQRNSVPAFYRITSDGDSIEKLQPLEVSETIMPLLTESLINRYIVLRHEIPSSFDELFFRWDENSEFYQLSSIGIYQRFASKMNSQAIINLVGQGVNRKVEIDFTKPLNNNLWLVQFKTITKTQASPQEQIVTWRSYLRVKYDLIKDKPGEEEGVHTYDYTLNPFGFKVISYLIAYLGTDNVANNYMDVAKKVAKLKNDEK